MILVVDNYDSFVYNLVQYVGIHDPNVAVRRNDAVDLDEVRELDPDGVVVSPGPGTPAEAGISVPLFEHVRRPVLGVCLGYQALCASEGAAVTHAPEVVHGKSSEISHDGKGIYAGLDDPLRVGRYHSLVVDEADLPDRLEVTARTADGVVMSVRHRTRPFVGVQYHPESILTESGAALVENFLDVCDDHRSERAERE